ncbi:glycosyltransferase [Candidatus Microgenomates bacterium]|nr:glycosyltransferase [Candidatus Microgenomates bacterium]
MKKLNKRPNNFRPKNKSFYSTSLKSLYKAHITEGESVLEFSYGIENVLDDLNLKKNHARIDISRKVKPLKTRTKFDRIIIHNLVEYVFDVQLIIERARRHIKSDGLLILSSINPLWKTSFKPEIRKNWQHTISLKHLISIVKLAGFQIEKSGYLMPKLSKLGAIQYLVAKPLTAMKKDPSVSIVIPCYNEEDNVVETVKQAPKLGRFTEIIVVDDASKDKTKEVAESLRKKYKNLKVVSRKLNGGKGPAVKSGIDAAKGDILIIWDADRTVPASELYRFYDALALGLGQFSNGTRMIYRMEGEAMRPLHVLGNTVFGWLFSWIFSNGISDTLCGTKALFMKDARKIEMGKERWGDFDLLFGAARLGLKIAEVPIHYKSRVAGESKMRTFNYGFKVGKMALSGMIEFKIKPILKTLVS